MKIFLVAGYTGDIWSALFRKLKERDYPTFWINAREEEIKIKQFIKEVLEGRKEKVNEVFFINCVGCFVFWQAIELTKKDFLNSFECNFLVPVKLIQIFSKLSIEILKGNTKKIIININSQAALKPFWYGGAYNSMKAALNMYLKIFEKENRNMWFKVKQFYPPVVKNTKVFENMPYKPKSDKIVDLEDFVEEVIREIIKEGMSED